MKRKFLLPLGALLAAIPFLVRVGPTRTQSRKAPMESALGGSFEIVSTRDGARGLRLRLLAGDCLEYDLDLALGMGDVDLTLCGRLRIAVLSREGEEYTIAFGIDSLRIELEAQEGRSDPVQGWAVVRSDGCVSSLSFPETLDVQSRLTLQSLLLTAQFLFPESSESQWSRIQEDTNGRYEARYRIEETRGDSVRIRRSKTRYVELFSPGELEVESEAVGSFHPEIGIPIALDAEERIRTGSPGTEVQGSLRLRLKERRHDPAAARRETDRFRAEGRVRSVAREDLREINRESRLMRLRQLVQESGITFESLVAWMESRPSPDESWRLMEKAVALFATDPGAVREARDRLRLGILSQETAWAILSALGSSQSEEAQDVLLELTADAALSGVVRRGAILGLAFCEKPRPAAATILRSVSDPDLSESALLTLGVVASRPGTKADETVRFLLDKLNVARDSREKTLALEALGNSESDAALEAVAQITEDGDESVRACAVHALRGMSGADAVLSRKAETDPSEQVRAVAIEILAARGSPSVVSLLAREPSERVRSAALPRLAARASIDPEVRGWLERISRSDPSPTIREQALQICADLGPAANPR